MILHFLWQKEQKTRKLECVQHRATARKFKVIMHNEQWFTGLTSAVVLILILTVSFNYKATADNGCDCMLKWPEWREDIQEHFYVGHSYQIQKIKVIFFSWMRNSLWILAAFPLLPSKIFSKELCEKLDFFEYSFSLFMLSKRMLCSVQQDKTGNLRVGACMSKTRWSWLCQQCES